MSPRNSPEPRLREQAYKQFNFPIVSARRLSAPRYLPNCTFAQISGCRKSERNFKRALTDSELSQLLWLSCRTIASRKERNGFIWEHRPSPSAGGRHPIHILHLNRSRGACDVELFIPQDQRLAKLNAKSDVVAALIRKCDEVLNTRSASLLVFAAEGARTASKYTRAESLIWRDAGSLMATMSFAATALGLPSCLMGLTCEPYLSRALKSDGAIVGVGGMVVGFSQR